MTHQDGSTQKCKLRRPHSKLYLRDFEMEMLLCNNHQFLKCDQTDNGPESLEDEVACITEILAKIYQLTFWRRIFF